MRFNLLFVLFISFTGFSQVQSVNREMKQFTTWDLTREIDPNAKIDKASGSPYSNDNFFDAQITIMDTVVTVPVKYNVVLDEMEFRKEDKTYALVAKENTVVRMLTSKLNYSYVKYNLNGTTKKGFLIKKTTNDKINFFLKQVITYVPFKEAVNAYSQPTPAHYRKDSDVFLIGLSDGNITEMPSKKKDLLKMFPNNEKQIEDFLKSNKISFKDENDLISLVNYLDTLN